MSVHSPFSSNPSSPKKIKSSTSSRISSSSQLQAQRHPDSNSKMSSVAVGMTTQLPISQEDTYTHNTSNHLESNNTNQNYSTTSNRFKRLFVKASFSCSIFFRKLKMITEQCLESDEITDQLFNNTNSSSSISDDNQMMHNNLHESAQQVATITTANNNNPNNVADDNCNIAVEKVEEGEYRHPQKLVEEKISDDGGTTLTNSIDYHTTTTVTASLSPSCPVSVTEHTNHDQDDSIPFSNGELLWQLQNKEWIKPLPEYQTPEGELRLLKKIKGNELKSRMLITNDDQYFIIYKNLIVNSKPLKRNMNLKDALRVVQSGWNWNKLYEGK